jgi:hypothetical protein
LVRGDRVRLRNRTGRISEVFATLVYVRWHAGNKQIEAHTRATLLAFRNRSPQSEMTFEGARHRGSQSRRSARP